MDVRALVQSLGGIPAVAAETGETGKTVSMWGTRNRIPRAHHITLWRMAQRANVDWTPPNAEGLALVPREAA